ncbi:hypothetical protein MMC07_003002 [Pseudocyphellaria aurata]|nr:hypothetical protein [Pseudocyphellaria aurata]
MVEPSTRVLRVNPRHSAGRPASARKASIRKARTNTKSTSPATKGKVTKKRAEANAPVGKGKKRALGASTMTAIYGSTDRRCEDWECKTYLLLTKRGRKIYNYTAGRQSLCWEKNLKSQLDETFSCKSAVHQTVLQDVSASAKIMRLTWHYIMFCYFHMATLVGIGGWSFRTQMVNRNDLINVYSIDITPTPA